MSAECDALKQELQRISQQIAALDNKYVLKTETPQIIEASVSKATTIIKALIPSIAIAALSPKLIKLEREAKAASALANQAKGISENAISRAEQAKLKARIAEAKGAEGIRRAREAQTTGELAAEIGKRARQEALVANTNASKLKRAVAAVDSKAAMALKKAGDAFQKSANAIGISNNALRTAKLGLKLAGKALAFIDVIFGIIATLLVARQLAAILRRLNVIERSLSPIYGLIGVNKSAIRRVEQKANAAYASAINAKSTAVGAAGVAAGAQATGSSALATALNALSVGLSLLYLRSLVPRIALTASAAQATAQQALARTAQPGVRGLPGLQGRPGVPGTKGLPGLRGLPGRAGAPGPKGEKGKPGLTGLFGLPGRAGAPGRRGLSGPRGLKGEDGALNPADSALLRKIDATTTADAAVGRQTQGLVRAQFAGVLAQLQSIQKFAETAWKNSRLGKLINFLTLVSVLHNAAMLSKDVGETIGDLTSNMLLVVGIKDEKGSQLDINELVGTSVKNFVQSIVGAEVYNDVSTRWKKASRIVSSAAMIAYTVRGLHDTSKDVMEWTAENTGKIGNALKKYGVVGERAYPWMSERVKSQDAYRRKFQRVTDGLESLEDTASSFSQVTGDVREIQEEFTELNEQKAAFKALVTTTPPADIPTSAPESAPVANTEATATEESQSAAVAIADAQKGS